MGIELSEHPRESTNWEAMGGMRYKIQKNGDVIMLNAQWRANPNPLNPSGYTYINRIPDQISELESCKWIEVFDPAGKYFWHQESGITRKDDPRKSTQWETWVDRSGTRKSETVETIFPVYTYRID